MNQDGISTRRSVLAVLGDAATVGTVAGVVGSTAGCVQSRHPSEPVDRYDYEPHDYEELRGNLEEYAGEYVSTTGDVVIEDFPAYYKMGVGNETEIIEATGERTYKLYPPNSDHSEEDYIPVLNLQGERSLSSDQKAFTIEGVVGRFYHDEDVEEPDYCIAILDG